MSTALFLVAMKQLFVSCELVGWFATLSRVTAFFFTFLVARKRLYMSVCPSVRPSVTLSFFGLLGATYGRVSGLVLFTFK